MYDKNLRVVFNKVSGKVLSYVSIADKTDISRYEKMGYMVATPWHYERWMFTITGKHGWLKSK